MPRKYRKFGEKLVLLMVILPVVAVLWTVLRTQDYALWGDGLYATSVLLFGYCLGCISISPYFVGGWMRRKFFQQTTSRIRNSRREFFDIQKMVDVPLLHGRFGKFLGLIPGNQATKLAFEHHELELKRNLNGLSGLRVVHLSDFHFTGQIGVEYFQELIVLVNQQEPDLIFITGDLVDETHCLDWIDSVFGELKSKHGIFFVLGNHDLRIKDIADMKQRLRAAGLCHVGGKWETININGTSVAIAGNELPWFAGADRLPVDPKEPAELKILLTHSPDQLDWAKSYGFDWMLAGHTHGGQIQFPIIGPIVAPSKYGVNYASGAFEIDSMLMYVSRGISGDEAIRINCPPEVSVFTLTETP